MNTKRVTAAAGVIHGSQVNGKRTATGIACDLDSACMLQDPEVAQELVAYRALELGDVDGRVSASCGKPHHPTWLRAVDDTRGCPWCEVDAAHEEAIGANLARWEEEQENARLRLALKAAQRGRREAREVARNAVRVTEQSVEELKREHAANTSYSSALPWARLMDDEDLSEFLAEVEHAIATPGATPAEGLAAVEEACGTWRLIAEAQHAHNIAPGPDVTESVDKLTRLLAPTQALRVPEPGACSTCTDGPADWCPGCSTCRCETHRSGCVQAGNPR
ncbi:hypothetical protein [Streptomyces sp. NPDC057336]|uniref:hypothetical protein n=1 Tax=Streptomyces sp. NPDC057336 TaxID=3346102 RepID=UPI00364222DC